MEKSKFEDQQEDIGILENELLHTKTMLKESDLELRE